MAQRFRFRLEPILKLRKHREDACKRIVAATLREIAKLRRERAKTDRQIDEQIDRMRDGSLVGKLDLGDVSRHRYWLTHLQRRGLEIDGRVRTLEARLAQERADLAESSRHKKVLTTLSDRQRQRFDRAVVRAERKEADEIATGVYLFNSPESKGA